MNNHGVWRGVLIAVLCIGTAAAIGVSAFHLGMAHGLAAAGQAPVGAPGIASYAYAWPYPWHGFFLAPLFWLFLTVLMVRALVGRRSWRGGCHYRDDGVPPAFEAWHRRAHAQQDPPKL